MTTATTTSKRRLVAKLAEIANEIDRIPKRGRNEYHGYDYPTEADVVTSVRAGLAARQVVLVSSVVRYELIPTPDGKRHLMLLAMRFTFHDGETGEELSADWMGSAEDAGDKALYKAYTGAQKYFLLKTFQIPTGDDPEREDVKLPHASPDISKPVPSRQVSTQQAQRGLEVPAPDVTVSIDDVDAKVSAKGRKYWRIKLEWVGNAANGDVRSVYATCFDKDVAEQAQRAHDDNELVYCDVRTEESQYQGKSRTNVYLNGIKPVPAPDDDDAVDGLPTAEDIPF